MFITNNGEYNPFLVYCRELAPGTINLTGDRAQGDDSKLDSLYTVLSKNDRVIKKKNSKPFFLF